jgi:hypothetical protein
MTPELDRLIERAATSAFDKGLMLGRKAPADAARARPDVVAYTRSLLRGYIEQEVQRQVAEERAAVAS